MSEFDQNGLAGQAGRGGGQGGRQKGMCRRTDDQTFSGLGSCQGQGQGRGKGMGMRSGGIQMSGQGEKNQAPAPSVADELALLKEQYQSAQTMLSTIGKKIELMEAGKRELPEEL